MLRNPVTATTQGPQAQEARNGDDTRTHMLETPVTPSRRRDDPVASEGPHEAICTVVVADPDEIERRQTRRLLRQVGFWVVAEAATASEAVAATIEHQPDLCLFEMDLPGGGARATSEVLLDPSDRVVVIYTKSERDEHVFGALRAGASGYLLKANDADVLAASLRGVLAGEASISRRLMRRVLADYSLHPASRGSHYGRLTAREREVAELMRHGLTTNEIADRLFVAPVTVRTHIAAIRRKLDAPDRSTVVEQIDGW
jgi:two-component system, NarL family, nitrate/nitrite response regulator NarL